MRIKKCTFTPNGGFRFKILREKKSYQSIDYNTQ